MNNDYQYNNTLPFMIRSLAERWHQMTQFSFSVMFFLTCMLASSPLLGEDASTPKEEKSNTSMSQEENENFFKADFQKAPTYIRSSEMTFFANDRKVEYRDNVEVIHEDMTLTCDRLEALYTEDNQIDQIFAYDNVYIVRETGTQARSEKAIYQHKTETVILTINPEIQEKGSVVTADKITIYLQEDRSEAEGEVRVKLVQAPDEKNKALPNASPGTQPGAQPAQRQNSLLGTF